MIKFIICFLCFLSFSSFSYADYEEVYNSSSVETYELFVGEGGATVLHPGSEYDSRSYKSPTYGEYIEFDTDMDSDVLEEYNEDEITIYFDTGSSSRGVK